MIVWFEVGLINGVIVCKLIYLLIDEEWCKVVKFIEFWIDIGVFLKEEVLLFVWIGDGVMF